MNGRWVGHADSQLTHEKVLDIVNYQENANQNRNEISLHTYQNVDHQERNKCFQGWEKGTLVHCWWECKLMPSLENSMELSQKSRSNTTLCFSSPTPGHIPGKGENSIQRDSCIPMFRTALFIIAKVWKQPKCPWTNKWIRKICIDTGMLLSHEKNEVVLFFPLTFRPKQFWMRSMQIPLLVLRFHWFLKSECWGPTGDTWTPFSWIVWHLPPCLQISGASS